MAEPSQHTLHYLQGKWILLRKSHEVDVADKIISAESLYLLEFFGLSKIHLLQSCAGVGQVSVLYK